MKTTEIKTHTGETFLVDAEDASLFASHSWRIDHNGYVRRTDWSTRKSKTLFAHLMVIDVPNGMCVDHINGDKTDNRKSNLRVATRRQNNCNRGIQAHNTSGYIGVSFRKDTDNWTACISVDGKPRKLGTYDCPKDAARVRDFWAVDTQGEFARLNEIDGYKRTVFQRGEN
jgi:hypothetical protein